MEVSLLIVPFERKVNTVVYDWDSMRQEIRKK